MNFEHVSCPINDLLSASKTQTTVENAGEVDGGAGVPQHQESSNRRLADELARRQVLSKSAAIPKP